MREQNRVIIVVACFAVLLVGNIVTMRAYAQTQQGQKEQGSGQIQSFGVQGYTKEVNTKTNVATYTSDGSLSMNMKATVYPNGTEILESKQP